MECRKSISTSIAYTRHGSQPLICQRYPTIVSKLQIKFYKYKGISFQIKKEHFLSFQSNRMLLLSQYKIFVMFPNIVQTLNFLIIMTCLSDKIIIIK